VISAGDRLSGRGGTWPAQQWRRRKASSVRYASAAGTSQETVCCSMGVRWHDGWRVLGHAIHFV